MARRGMAAVAAALAGVAMWAGGAPAGAVDPQTAAPVGAQAAPSITISPSGPWLAGHRVTVTGSGLAPATGYTIVECVGSACTPPLLYTSPGPGTNPAVKSPPAQIQRAVLTDATGSFTASIDLARGTYVAGPGLQDGTEVDCLATACDLAVVTGADEVVDIGARTPLTFSAGSYVWPAASLAVAPSPPATHRGDVAVQAAGLDQHRLTNRYSILTSRWETEAEPQVCGPGAGPVAERCVSTLMFFDLFDIPSVWADVAPDGTVDDTVRVRRFLPTATGWVDCAAVACTLRLTQPKVSTVEVSLAFAPVWAPWSSAEAMVDGLRELLGADALTAADRSTLVQDLEDGELDAVDVMASLATQNPVTGDVATLYVSLLHRRPDLGGLDFWVARLRSGAVSAGRVADTFSNTAEVRAQHQGMADAEAVEWAYQATLGRGSDPSGKAYWVGRLAAGLPRFRMLSMFALAAESRSRTTPARVLTVATRGLLGTVPTAEAWTSTAPGQGVALGGWLWNLLDTAPAFRAAA